MVGSALCAMTVGRRNKVAHTTIKQLKELETLKELSSEQRKRVLLKKKALEKRLEIIDSILNKAPRRRRAKKS